MDRYLTFRSDGQLFGVSIAEVVQIVGIQKITELPEYPACAKGVISLQGGIFPVIDMRLCLGRPEAPYSDRTCIIMVNIQENGFGFIVDEVDEVLDILPEQITHPPQIRSEGNDFYLTGIARVNAGLTGNEKIILIVDMAKLLSQEVFTDLFRTAHL
ncbi:chemotaxis protein CheW [Lachnospiraceae bacterium 54-53]